MRVPAYEPNVSLRPAYQSDMGVRASPEAFGAGVGRGMTQVAQGLDRAGDALQRMRDLEDETRARHARNEYIKRLDVLQFDPEAGFMHKQGKDAVDGFVAFKGSLVKLKSEIATGASLSPGARALFDQSAEMLEIEATRSALVHRGKAMKEFVVAEARNGAENFKGEALFSYRDQGTWNKFVMAGLREIEGLGEKLGWSQSELRREQQAYLSDAHRLTAMQMAGDDPIAAADYALKHRNRMTAPDHLAVMRELAPAVSEAVVRDAVSVKAARPGPRKFAAEGLPAEAYDLLSLIAGTESPGYDVINGGARFASYADHPRRPGAGGSSTAAGRYQFVKGTWDRVSEALGLSDFTPVSQDVAAWWLAQADYKERTGRDLGADLRAGKHSEVRAGLAGTWEGIKKLTDEQFAECMAAGGDVVIPGGAQFSPRVEKLLADLPDTVSIRLRESAQTGVEKFEADRAGQERAARLVTADGYRLRIASDDVTLTKGEILDDPVLNDGDRASLLNSLASKRGEAWETGRAVDLFRAGELRIDPYDTRGRAVVDNVWSALSASADQASLRPVVEDIVRQTGVVPKQVSNAIIAGLTSGNAQTVAQAAQTASHLSRIDQAAFERREGGKEIASATTAFSYYVDRLGMPPAEAAQRMVDARDPAKIRERSALMETAEVKEAIKAQATEAKVRNLWDRGLFRFDPTLGDTPAQAAAMVAEYRDILEVSVVAAAGDVGLARELAEQRFKRLYGPSQLTLSGPTVVTRLPPENTYPAGLDGTHDYIRKQAVEALTGAGIAAEKVYLQADEMTEGDFSAGRPARYQVFYEADGALERHPLPFFAVPPTSEEIKIEKRTEFERRWKENRDLLEAGRDREGNLDRMLNANPLTGGLETLGDADAVR